jgi:hypothetical protein
MDDKWDRAFQTLSLNNTTSDIEGRRFGLLAREALSGMERRSARRIAYHLQTLACPGRISSPRAPLLSKSAAPMIPFWIFQTSPKNG